MHLVRKKGEVGSWGIVSKALLSFLNSSLNCNVKDFESIKNNYEYQQKKNPEDNISVTVYTFYFSNSFMLFF